jgi:hypothetical protein
MWYSRSWDTTAFISAGWFTGSPTWVVLPDTQASHTSLTLCKFQHNTPYIRMAYIDRANDDDSKCGHCQLSAEPSSFPAVIVDGRYTEELCLCSVLK